MNFFLVNNYMNLNCNLIILFLLLPILDAAEIVESLVKLLVDRMLEAKENIGGNMIASLRNEDLVMMSFNYVWN